ncbi:hypothetical protein BU16DRAFT_582599 [Lophium mytilinum]|uniref:Uncharacterized protein n=1 Tax=Lophium mytilinum TaxID=390894 RepID=A0A6A6QQU7_9PEZI|nr:hypothetical protein BU16DRAFT_582599 [Lophium mytilinum]
MMSNWLPAPFKANTMAPTPTFRFLDLPSEVRIEVYKILLCDASYRADHGPFEHPYPVPQIIETIPHSIKTKILTVSKSIYREAYDVMLKGNLFVRITSQGLDLENFLLVNRIAIITRTTRCVSAFNGYVMHHHLSNAGYSSPEYDLMLLYRDLDKFCAALGEGHKTYRDCQHSLDIFNIFSEPELPRKHQELLLRPYTTHLHSFPHLQITGVDLDLCQRALESIRRLAWSTPADVNQYFTQKHSLAVTQLLGNDYTSSAHICRYAIAQLCNLKNSNDWGLLLDIGGPEFSQSVVSLGLDFYSTLSRCTLWAMRFAAGPKKQSVRKAALA